MALCAGFVALAVFTMWRLSYKFGYARKATNNRTGWSLLYHFYLLSMAAADSSNKQL
jgi:hypothetical protein